jgi:hypothetical protein
MIRFLMILTLALVVFAACPPRFSADENADGGTAQAATAYRSELGRLAQSTAAMRQAALNADMGFPEPRPEVLFPMGR